MRCLILLSLIVPGILCGIAPPHKMPTEAAVLQRLEDRLVSGLTKFISTGEFDDDTSEAIKYINAPGAFRNLDTEPQPVVCSMCKVMARMIIKSRKMGVPLRYITAPIKKLCVKAKIENEIVCNGVIDLNAPIFVYIIDNKPDITVDAICSTIAQSQNCPVNPEDDNNWSVSIPRHLEDAPQVEEPPKTNQIIRTRDETARPIRILHISDIHFDELYAPGANAECEEALCCGSNQGIPATPEAAAGNWGDYRSCDMPWHSVLALMNQVKKHEIDFVYYTGDIINHRVWETSIESNVRSIKKVSAEFRKTFTSTPVFSILGNHEPNPVNVYAQANITDPDLSTQWLYDLIAEEWKQWLPNDARETVKQGGFYTVLARPGFRIIGLNNNMAYTFNWWIIYDQSMLQEQLQWLVDTLAQAEKDGEIVHILSHIPNGDSTCLLNWSAEYTRIIQRFSHIITAQFVGHTHYNEMNLFFNNSNVNDPISVAFNGGSFTTFTNVNPNYKIYEVNPKTLEIENYDHWIYNVTEANQNSLEIQPRWFKLYSFKEAYGLESMKLPELSRLVQRMASNQTLLNQYYRHKMRDGDQALLNGCDQNCHENNLCNLVTTQFGESKVCTELLEQYRATLQ